MPNIPPIEKVVHLPNIPFGSLVDYELQYNLDKVRFAEVTAKLENLAAYEEKLHYFFHLKDGNLSFTLSAITTDGADEHNVFPKDEAERKTYNMLVQELMAKENSQGACFYTTAEEYQKKLEARIKIDPNQADVVLNQELERIEQEHLGEKEAQNLEYLDFGDKPGVYVSKGEGKSIRSKIFNYLLVNRVIDFEGQFINWWHHLEILTASQQLDYYKNILSERQNLKAVTSDASDNQYVGREKYRVATGSLTINNDYKPKIVLLESKVKDTYGILKDFFPSEQQGELLKLLKGESINKKLLFVSVANRLADAFRQMFDANFIPGATKTDLIKWIAQYFEYLQGKEVRNFDEGYLEKVISTSDDRCKKPIIGINNRTGEIFLEQNTKKRGKK